MLRHQQLQSNGSRLKSSARMEVLLATVVFSFVCFKNVEARSFEVAHHCPDHHDDYDYRCNYNGGGNFGNGGRGSFGNGGNFGGGPNNGGGFGGGSGGSFGGGSGGFGGGSGGNNGGLGGGNGGFGNGIGGNNGGLGGGSGAGIGGGNNGGFGGGSGAGIGGGNNGGLGGGSGAGIGGGNDGGLGGGSGAGNGGGFGGSNGGSGGVTGGNNNGGLGGGIGGSGGNSGQPSGDVFGNANGNSGLKVGFYSSSCPNAESIVRAAFSGNFATDPTAPAALLRLAFHDCQVGGCDASILLDSKGSSVRSERDSDKNFGIRRLDFIDRIKTMLEVACPGVVSCADIVVLVARESIVFTGGPTIPVLTGRRDGTTASNIAADKLLPPATITVDNFLSLFKSKGLTTEESVAIIGAHTIGVGHCVNIVNRLYPNQDSKIGLLFASRLRLQCPTADARMMNNATIINNDMTNLVFDNQYYRDLMNGQGLFTIDSELALDPRTSQIVASFGMNNQLFLNTFSSAFIKLTSSNVLTGHSGQIRKFCHSIN